jgi:carbamoyl-phosphate synthase large subunit
MSFRLLITAAGGALSAQTILFAKRSARHDIAVIAVDMSEIALGRYVADAFEVVPHGNDAGYVARICEVVGRHGADLILPCSDEEALALAAARERIEALGCTLACADIDTLRVMADKARAYAALRDAGFPVPAFETVADGAALERAIGQFSDERGEFVIKRAQGARGGRGTLIVHGEVRGARPFFGGRETEMDHDTFRRDYLDAVADALPVMVCERLVPPAYDVDVLARQGKALRAVPRRRLNPAGVPYRGYVVEPRDDLSDIAAGTARALELSWLYDFDVMCARDGRPAILELNPRPSGSFATSVAAGVPLIDDLVSLAKGEDLPAVPASRRPLKIVPRTTLEVVEG